ncbi:MAG: PIN domain-containing protein [Thermodesulfobacteriota bacterium]|nr:PIN domain-containing protein [Thermodesulfobacteriota bacterium]
MDAPDKKRQLRSVLIDTPVWQEYFRKEEHTFLEVNALIDTGRVSCLDLIVAELIHTAETEEERKVFQDFSRIFPILLEKPGTWVEAARLAGKLRQKGKELPLRDLYIAVMARSHEVFLYTTNKAIYKTCRALGLKLFPEGGSFA